ncbi:YegP family protein [Pseudozobellia thermophila]|uniref:DUF1508 domain-containing protein n=1 Tax=Pseudozobellia thermophila TaxID=192903 RepID=A0A1M6LAY0_9FLAO|nr:DUF1508 domain-containing protein [Pseudozobellia thermophila]SHJ68348.1 hypothetical protein SAMN04488513_10791 [Pseudozobellia thermophila]
MVKTYFDDNGYHFSITAPNGTTILKSVTFTDKSTMQQAIARLRSMPLANSSIERTTNHDGRFLFGVKDHNGRVMAHSLSYGSEAGMENGIKNLAKVLGALEAEGD